ncbi:MAG: hypothetical protein CMJ19_13590 [Phycisphaeraceae bacterium]|nr:hypothetical protein [Phycisphaeraceae bacterium]
MIGIALSMVVMKHQRREHRHPRQSSQLRGIHSALVLFSQGNNTYYPGFNTLGKTDGDITVEGRFKALLDDNYFTGEYIISPSETKTALTQMGVMPTTANYSYALLNLADESSPRMAEWRDTSNSESVVVSDRAITNGKEGAIRSVHTNPRKDQTQWHGEVAYNDNHVTFEATHDRLDTQYGDASFVHDNLFDTQGASLIYSGNDKIIDPGK